MTDERFARRRSDHGGRAQVDASAPRAAGGCILEFLNNTCSRLFVRVLDATLASMTHIFHIFTLVFTRSLQCSPAVDSSPHPRLHARRRSANVWHRPTSSAFFDTHCSNAFCALAHGFSLTAGALAGALDSPEPAREPNMARPMELPNPQEAPWATIPAREPTAEGAAEVCVRAGGGAPALARGADRGGGAERRRAIWGGEV